MKLKDYLKMKLIQWLYPDINLRIEHSINSKLSALQALDIGYRESGKIILIARVGKQDIVKIFDVSPSKNIQDYKVLVERLEAQFGATVNYIDCCASHKPMFEAILK